MSMDFHFPIKDVPFATSLLGAFLLVFGLYSSFIKEKLYLSEALLTTILGSLVGPYVGGWLLPYSWEGVNEILLEFSRLVIAMQIMAAVMNLPLQYFRFHWKSIMILILPVMVASWLISATIIYLILGIPFTKALIIGAAIAPTDPVLANSIVKGAFADRHVSLHIRHLLSGESACNDCTAAPFLYLSILLDQSQPWTKVLFEFSLYHLLYELGVGAVLGAIMGYTFRKALHYSKRHDLIDQENFLSFTLALSFLANGSAYLLKANDFLAVLSAAIAFSWDGKFSQLTSTSQIQEVLDNLVNAFFFILLGAVLPWPSITVGLIEFWKYLVASILILLFRRIPMTFLMYPILSSLTSPMEALFVGHFGPMAVGSVYYLQVILHKADVPLANDFILFIVFLSILVHGMTVPLFQISTVAMRTFSGSHSPHITHIRRISVTKGITISAPLHLHPFHSDTLNSKDTVTLEISEEEECVSELELETTVRTTEESHQIT